MVIKPILKIIDNRIASLAKNDDKNISTNPFIYYLSNKSNLLWWKMEVKLFTYYLSKISPDFNMLWQIADFINYIELLYMYPNNNNIILLDSKSSIRSFRIQHETFYIEYTLFLEDKLINIKIVRSDNRVMSEISFPDGQGTLENRTDMILMFNIIEWTVNPIKDLFKEYYYGKAKVI